MATWDLRKEEAKARSPQLAAMVVGMRIVVGVSVVYYCKEKDDTGYKEAVNDAFGVPVGGNAVMPSGYGRDVNQVVNELCYLIPSSSVSS